MKGVRIDSEKGDAPAKARKRVARILGETTEVLSMIGYQREFQLNLRKNARLFVRYVHALGIPTYEKLEEEIMKVGINRKNLLSIIKLYMDITKREVQDELDVIRELCARLFSDEKLTLSQVARDFVLIIVA